MSSGFEGSGRPGTKAAKGAAQGLAEELRATSQEAQAAEARKVERQRRQREAQDKKAAREMADRIIAELPEKMREAAKKGDTHHVVFLWLSKHNDVAWRAWGLVCQYARENGLKTSESRMDPFGSDPMFDHPVWTLTIHWGDEDKQQRRRW